MPCLHEVWIDHLAFSADFWLAVLISIGISFIEKKHFPHSTLALEKLCALYLFSGASVVALLLLSSFVAGLLVMWGFFGGFKTCFIFESQNNIKGNGRFFIVWLEYTLRIYYISGRWHIRLLWFTRMGYYQLFMLRKETIYPRIKLLLKVETWSAHMWYWV